MKTRNLVLIGALLATFAYAGWMNVNVGHLRAELTTLRAAHLRLQESHRQMRHTLVESAARPGIGDENFRKLVAVLESEGGADIITPSNPGTTRINTASGIQIK